MSAVTYGSSLQLLSHGPVPPPTVMATTAEILFRMGRFLRPTATAITAATLFRTGRRASALIGSDDDNGGNLRFV